MSSYIILREVMQYLCNKLFPRRKSKTLFILSPELLQFSSFSRKNTLHNGSFFKNFIWQFKKSVYFQLDEISSKSINLGLTQQVNFHLHKSVAIFDKSALFFNSSSPFKSNKYARIIGTFSLSILKYRDNQSTFWYIGKGNLYRFY